MHKIRLGNTHLNQYKLFRPLNDLNRQVKKHELVGVVYGKDIYSVTNELMKIATDDMLGLPKYNHSTGYSAHADPPQSIDDGMWRVKRYAYTMTVVVVPYIAEHNDLLDYGIMENSSTQARHIRFCKFSERPIFTKSLQNEYNQFD